MSESITAHVYTRKQEIIDSFESMKKVYYRPNDVKPVNWAMKGDIYRSCFIDLLIWYRIHQNENHLAFQNSFDTFWRRKVKNDTMHIMEQFIADWQANNLEAIFFESPNNVGTF